MTTLWELRKKVRNGKSLIDAARQQMEAIGGQSTEINAYYEASIEAWRNKEELWKQETECLFIKHYYHIKYLNNTILLLFF